MSLTSPLENLADKFNILIFNTRELISKLSYWAITSDDYLDIVLKCKDAPYFEKYKIPSKSFLSNYSTNWINSSPRGVKYWGDSVFDSTYKVNDDYVVEIDPTTNPRVNYIEYNVAEIEDHLLIKIDASTNVGDILDFIIKINPSSTDSTVDNLIVIRDNINSTDILKLGRHALTSFISNNSETYTPKIVKVSLQMIKKSTSSTNSWVVLDLYEMPTYEYKDGSVSYMKNNFKDPFSS